MKINGLKRDMNIAPRKLLIVNIFGIGDVLFTTPIINNLKAFFPDLKLGYLCNRRTEEMLKRNKKLDKIHVYERDEFKALYKRSKPAYFLMIKDFIKELKEQGYDTAIDVSLNTFTSFLVWFIGVKNRYVINYKNRSFPLNNRIDIDGYEEKHVIEYYLDLLRVLDIPVLTKGIDIGINEQDLSWAEEFFKRNSLLQKKLVVGIVPGGGASWGKDAIYKRWPLEKYAKLADNLIENYGAEIILMGDKNEVGLCSSIAKLMRNKVFSACGDTTLFQFGALARRCNFCVLNDGGPLHVAVAAGARVVSVFGPVEEKVYGPYPAGHHLVVAKDIPCRPCYHRFKRASCEHVSCLKMLEAQEVLERIKKIL
ncbi:MAG: glycosyltransferase family 9 protein [Candidatus Omnitrophica bacterium]|nr:glycosyltransferase family 9 protein [Candidatus Omnitrophota bacterium]